MKYVFIYFTGPETNSNAEQVYLSVSKDGLHFQDLNDEQPILKTEIGDQGVRDLYLVKRYDHSGYYLIGTDLSIYHRGGWAHAKATTDGSKSLIVWKSKDLIEWSKPWLTQVIPDNAGMAWAPEAIYDKEKHSYFVFWASNLFKGCKNTIIVGAYTKDFKNFSPAQEFIKRSQQDVIDTTIVWNGQEYIRASRDGKITIEKAKSLAGSWHKVVCLQDLDLGIKGDSVEGPEFCYLDDLKQWCLYVDQFSTRAGYMPILTKDIASNNPNDWHIASDYDFGRLKKRHGTIQPISDKEYQKIINKYGIII